jgi:hypothetical protein
MSPSPSVLDRIGLLELTVAEERRGARRSLVILAVLYALLVPLVAWDATRVLHQIQAAAHPDNVAALAAHHVRARLPELQQRLTTDIERQAPEIAARVTASAHDTIPVLGELARRNLALAADRLVQAMNERHVPAVVDFVRASLGDLPQQTARLAGDPDVTRRIAELTVQALDRELALALSDTLLDRVAVLGPAVGALAARPAAELTARERAEKAVLVNALYLVNRSERGDTSLLAQGLRAVLAALLPRDMFTATDRPLVPGGR